MVQPINVIDLINNLKDKIDDFARPNLFEVFIETGKNNLEQSESDSLSITHNLIRSINIPQVSISDIIIKRMDRKITLPGSIDYGDINITLALDDTGFTRRFLTEWHKKYIGNARDGVFGDPINYVSGTITIYQLNGKQERTNTTRFDNAFLKTIGEIAYNHEAEDQILIYNVIFGFYTMTVIK